MSVRAVLVRLSVEQVCCQSQGVSLSLRSYLYLYYCVRFSTSNPETTDAWLITEIYGYLKNLLGKNTSLCGAGMIFELFGSETEYRLNYT